MKLRNNKFKIIFLYLIIFIFSILIIKNLKQSYIQEDFLFFKFMGNTYENQLEKKEEIATYQFDVSNQKMDIKTIDMNSIFGNKQIFKEKIAPGTKGKFSLKIKSNEIQEYEIEFSNKNQKPKNLLFYLEEEKKFKSIEQFGKYLNEKNLKKFQEKIIIYWEWEYEQGDFQDIQDTKDGKLLENYCFDIIIKII